MIHIENIKTIVFRGIKTKYKISDSGVIYGKHGKVMMPRYTPNGYMQACMRIKGKYYYPYIHRIVYTTFIGKIPDGCEINHIDGNKCNNHISNLEAISRKENISHSWKESLSYIHNLHEGSHEKEKIFLKKYSIDTVHEICEQLEYPELTYAKIAEINNIPINIVYEISNGKMFKYISSKYNISERMKKRADLYAERDKKILYLKNKGYTAKEIADELFMSIDAVYRRYQIIKAKNKHV